MSTSQVSNHRDAPSVPAEARGKRILFIGLSYYSYTGKIVDALKEKGFAVKYYPLENRSFWWKTTRKLLPSGYKFLLRNYHARIVAAERRSRYDYVFFLQIHYLSVEHVENLRNSQRTAKFILYNWDSLSTHDYRPYLRHLDSVFTFDRNDAAEVGVRYLPLFALPEYFAASAKVAPAHDVYFVGAIGTLERFAALRKLDAYCREQNIRFAKHLHCSPAILLKLLRNRLFIKGVTLRALSTQEIIRLMNDSIAVFDFPNHVQSGFTMRLIENMCAGKKVVTSNAAVREEEFYAAEQFFVAENLDFTGLKGFLKSDLQASKDARPRTRHAEFSLDHWLDRIFEG
jgi:hypothetical protein